ncbi:MAG: hypothetical protein JNK29_04050 [Anaerolineales bacterium]|nr:hypothetical protein [Anaerolineales bacterium]
MSNTFRRLSLAGLALAALAGLACQTVTLLPERLNGGAPPTPPALAPAPTEAPAEPAAPAAGGPTIGTPRETRAAIADQVTGLEEAAAETYAPEDLDRSGARATYTIQLDTSDTPLLWGFGWCAADPDILAQNLDAMRFEFSVDGESVDLALFDMVEGLNDNDQACRLYRAVVYNWPAGDTTLETRVTFVSDVNDGLSDYPAGDMLFTYVVTTP